MRCRRWPTLPRPLGRSTIGAVGLNDRVRDGNGCGPYALIASEFFFFVTDSESATRAERSKRRGRDRSCDASPSRCSLNIACSAVENCLSMKLRVVKPHGRLGPLRSEVVAHRPRAAYRRRRLRRPFRELEAPGAFILGTASHLDAFSGYPCRPSLPGGAPGGTAGTRAGRPTRSSRTKVRAPQRSNAHGGYRPNCLTTF